MNAPIELRSDDEIVKNAKYTIYGYRDRRTAQQFLPQDDEPQTKEIPVSWGGTLTAKKGDYLVQNADNPADSWPVEKDIFEKSYEEEKPGTGVFKKVAAVAMVPMTAFTNGDPDQLVTVYTLEGSYTIEAGKFHLARGIKGEIWAFHSEAMEDTLYKLE